MFSFKKISNLTGWLVFSISAVVYYLSAERTGSLWDCGEFILGAYKLQVVHPPGAPLFLLVGRLFAWIATIVSDKPEDIAFAVNMLSGISTAFAAMFIAWVTIILGKIAMVGRAGNPDNGQTIALAFAGLAAGLATAFSVSIWFSAVEGEVYALSTFFTALTLWATIHWYHQPDEPKYDKWLIFAIYSSGLSLGVHLLSILTFPALAFFFYLKKYKEFTFRGMVASLGVGLLMIFGVQSFIVSGLPKLWGLFDMFMVNSLGLPFHSGLVPLVLILVAGVVFGLRYAERENNPTLQNAIVAVALLIVSYATYGMVVTRANASPPINMNTPTDAMRLLPYLNREQYGERALLRGPHFDARPIDVKSKNRYGRVGDKYEVVDERLSYVYDKRQEMAFPRLSDGSQGRPSLYKRWLGLDPSQPLPPGRPNMGDNVSFFFKYQLSWMYWRYFMWNFSGRQNAVQGYYPWDKSNGHWISGIPFIDNIRLGDQSKITRQMREDKGRNRYFLLPFLFGLLGVIYHYNKRKHDFLGLLFLFGITGIGIIIYANQPPNEPRERDYVMVGSFFTFCIWIGLGVLALYEILQERLKLNNPVGAGLAGMAVMAAPLLMLTQNFDDMSRRDHYASRDYASNFLESCAPNAILFTYGDNDTYPLWYAQEVEGIRTDVRVVNLSLIAVDWYIDLLRRKVNDSPALKLSISSDAMRGSKRNQVLYPKLGEDREMSLQQFLKFIGEDHPLPLQSGEFTESYMPTQSVYLPVDRAAAQRAGLIGPADSVVVDRIPINLAGKDFLQKDDIAVLDIIASNLWERPIYFSVTTRPEKFFGLDNYMQLEGLGLRIVPVQSPSDQSFGLIGSGRVATDIFYKNVMEKFRWGNFDKKETFVDNSYMPSLQSMQLGMRRAAGEILRSGQKEKAVALTDKYFEVFPDMNFPYDYRAYYMLDVYMDADAYNKAKPIMEILAQNTEEQLRFYTSVSPDILANSFQLDYDMARRTMDRLIADAKRGEDKDFQTKLEARFAPYRVTGQPDPSGMPPAGQ
ncbi:MAG: protein O-mannosyl-transferase family [Saprospiraceae bacterium]|jgi:hypothetical protein